MIPILYCQIDKTIDHAGDLLLMGIVIIENLSAEVHFALDAAIASRDTLPRVRSHNRKFFQRVPALP